MELKHSFTVPVAVDEAFATFEDIASVAECFPGATVTSVSGQTFEGNAKVKLGPIAMQYTGSGSFVERDAAAHRMVVEAKGRDKRGNGTAGATIRATFSAAGDATTNVEVLTDLQITGKPAQFGRGVIQDVSDKLLGQFVDCLQQRIGTAPGGAGPADGAPADGEPDSPVEPAAGAGLAGAAPPDAGPDSPVEPAAPAGPATPAAAPAEVRTPGEPPAATGGADDALDLGAAVLPVLARQYGPPAAAALLLLLLLRRWLARRR